MLESINCSLLLKATFFGGFLATTATLSLACPPGAECRSTQAKLEHSPKRLVDEVWQIVNQRFVDGNFNQVNWKAVRQGLLGQNYTSREQAYTAIQAALKKLGDPYTRFLKPQQFAAFNEQTIAGELSGIGIQMQLDQLTQRITVVKVLEKSPALAAGLQAGDRILAIDGKPIQNMDIEQASKLIRGQTGTPVALRIQRLNQSNFDVKITRATIELPYVSYTLKQEGPRRIGYIRLTEFSATAPEQMRQAIQTLNSQDVNGFVLDLRGNPGGLLIASVEITRMWLDDGLIVREEERVSRDSVSRSKTEFSANGAALTQKPLVVLVDGESASASEIVAGALKDNKRAMIVGSKTFGKASVQQVYPLSDGSALTVTVGRYLTPSGTYINRKGIVPDVKIDLTTAQQQQLAVNPALIGTPSDPQYARAIAVLTSNFFAAWDGKR